MRYNFRREGDPIPRDLMIQAGKRELARRSAGPSRRGRWQAFSEDLGSYGVMFVLGSASLVALLGVAYLLNTVGR